MWILYFWLLVCTFLTMSYHIWPFLTNVEQCWAMLANVEQCWAMLTTSNVSWQIFIASFELRSRSLAVHMVYDYFLKGNLGEALLVVLLMEQWMLLQRLCIILLIEEKLSLLDLWDNMVDKDFFISIKMELSLKCYQFSKFFHLVFGLLLDYLEFFSLWF